MHIFTSWTSKVWRSTALQQAVLFCPDKIGFFFERSSPGIRDLDLVLLHQLCPPLSPLSPCLTSAAEEKNHWSMSFQNVFIEFIGQLAAKMQLNSNWMANLSSLSLPGIQVSTRLFAKPQGPMSICSACWWSRCSSWDLASQNIATSTRPSHLSVLSPFVSFFSALVGSGATGPIPWWPQSRQQSTSHSRHVRFPKNLLDVGWCWMMLDDVGWCWMMLDDVGWCWTDLSNSNSLRAGGYRTVTSFGRAAKTRRISSSASQGAELCVFGSSTCADEIWVCLKMGYTPNYSHLVGIMIINHWV